MIKGLLLLLITIATYWAALHNGFVWDDQVVFFSNPLITHPGNWDKLWRGIGTSDYFPLSYSLLKAGWMAWNDWSRGFHALNLALHASATIALWRLLILLRVPGSWIGAAFFAIHPVNVATVAWVSEIKNSLSLLLLLFASFLFFQAPPRRSRIMLSLVFFSASLLAKSSGVTTPISWLLILWWKGHLGSSTWRLNLFRATPFLAASLVAGMITLWFQTYHSIAGSFPEVNAEFSARLLRAVWAIGFDFLNLGCPLSLSFLYSNRAPSIDIGPWLVAAGALIVTVLAFARRKRSLVSRGWLAGFGCFVILAMPVLGLLPMYYLRLAPVADQWLYLPGIPILAMAGAAIARVKSLSIRYLLSGIVILLLSCKSAARCGELLDNQTLWKSVLRSDPKSWYATMNLAVELGKKDRLEEAESLARSAVFLGPNEPEALLNLIAIIGLRHREQEALDLASTATAKFPKVMPFALLQGKIAARMNRLEEASVFFERALTLDPNNSSALFAFAEALLQLKQSYRLINPIKSYLLNNPNDSQAWNYLGMVYALSKNNQDAEACFHKSLKISPNNQSVLDNLEIIKQR